MASFDGDIWNIYYKENSGLPSNFIGKIAIDENNTKWISTPNNGVTVFNENGIPSKVHEPITLNKSIKIFPNPSNDFVNISFETRNRENITLYVYNIQGQVIRSIPLGVVKKVNYSIDCSELPKGLYVIGVNTRNDVLTQKLLIN